jgi:hypothetical protein
VFQLTSESIIPIATLAVYAAQVVLITAFYGKSRLKRPLLLFMLSAAAWSASSWLATAPSLSKELFPTMMVPVFSSWAVVAYFSFAAVFVERGMRPVTRLGYTWLAVVVISVLFGLATQAVPELNNVVVYRYYGWFLEAVALGKWALLAVALLLLSRRFKTVADPEERNRTAYLLLALCLVVIIGIASSILPGQSANPFSLAFAINAALMTYALARYRLLNMQLVVKKWVVYVAVSVGITAAYLGLLLGLNRLLPLLPPPYGIPTTIVSVVLFGCLFNWLKTWLDKAADRLFYGKGYAQRQLLHGFTSKMSSLIKMEEVADALLKPLAKAVGARRATLLLGSNDY